MRRPEKRKKVCVFTGTRAEYGLLREIMREITADRKMRLQILASGAHLSLEFGYTIRDIERDGFTIDEKIEMLLSSDSPAGITKSMGIGLIGFADAISRLDPDFIVILGDRFEAFCAAASALIANIPIAHIGGGASTIGAVDEAMRHSITKMSILHFTSTDEYRRRVIRLGENPDRVFAVGAPGIEVIKRLRLLSKKDVEEQLGVRFKRRNLLVTFHPATAELGASPAQFRQVLKAIDGLADTFTIFTKANADALGRSINAMIDDYVSIHPDRAASFHSLGQDLYLSVMHLVDAAVGNSSSGIIEAPSFRIGTINIGDRQKGRIKAASIIGCEPEYRSIKGAFSKLYSKSFQKRLATVKNPYDYGGSPARRIKDIIKQCDGRRFLKKEFYCGK